MKTITIHVPEETYRAYQDHAAQSRQSASELIRNAMEEYYQAHLAGSGSVFDGEPAPMGQTLAGLSPDDDILEEMLPGTAS
jgi:hypothetical protein